MRNKSIISLSLEKNDFYNMSQTLCQELQWIQRMLIEVPYSKMVKKEKTI
jgi:hypothetical protein